MAIGINGYNATFKAFADFAQQRVEANDSKAVAKANLPQPLAGRNIMAVTQSRTDSIHKFSRSSDACAANDITRTIFKRAVIDIFGGESKIPESVKKSMLLSDFGYGKPLTARRILAVKTAIDNFNASEFVKNLPETLDVDVGGETFTFDKWHYKRIVSNTPPAECPRSLDELKHLLSARISNGREIIRDVLAGNGTNHAATPANVADLTLALHAAALRHGEKLPDGSFSVADPDGRLAQWLDTSSEVYIRTSSHIRGYQQMQVDGHLNMPRGIDIPEGKNGLMAGMRTVHYGTVPDLDTGGSGPKRRLFLKCETFGVWHNTITKDQINRSMSPGMTTRTAREGDWRESISHMFSFVATRGADATAGGARKEHMTHRVKVALETSVANLKAAGRKDLAAMLEEGNVKKAGTRMLLHNLDKAVTLAPEDATLRGAVAMIFKAVTNDAAGLAGDLHNRLGNEIMIETADFL